MRLLLWIVVVGITVLDASVACAQSYPSKPIRIVTSGAGSGTDFGARLIAQALSADLGQSVIVENRAGGSGLIGEIVTRATPDGYTLLLAAGTLWIAPFLQKMPYDPVHDFAPISLTSRSPNVLVVSPATAVKSVKELIALAKAEPGKLNYASAATGTSPHLAAELFRAMAGVSIVRIEYRATAPALIALIGGEVQMMFSTAAPVAPHVKSGRLRALAVTSAQPSPLAPGLPTVAASGLPGYDIEALNGIFAPAKTPAAVITRLNSDIVRLLHQTDLKDKFLSSGAEVVASTPQELAATVKADMAKMGKVIKDAGIRIE